VQRAAIVRNTVEQGVGDGVDETPEPRIKQRKMCSAVLSRRSFLSFVKLAIVQAIRIAEGIAVAHDKLRQLCFVRLWSRSHQRRWRFFAPELHRFLNGFAGTFLL